MQPVLTQVPPNSLRSTIATFIPAAVSRPARDGPACPAPMTMASKTWVMARVHDEYRAEDRGGGVQQGGKQSYPKAEVSTGKGASLYASSLSAEA
jgi:hypothetical protein